MNSAQATTIQERVFYAPCEEDLNPCEEDLITGEEDLTPPR